MNRIFSVRSGLVLMLVCGLMFVSGCQKVSGTYTGSDLTINFKSSSKADVTIMGQTQETDYTVNGNQITLTPPGGAGQAMVLTIADDGSLQGPTGVKLTKQ